MNNQLQLRLESLEHHLDAVAGVQLAMDITLKLLVSVHKGNPQAIEAMKAELERRKADLLSSRCSDYKLAAFDQTAESLMTMVS